MSSESRASSGSPPTPASTNGSNSGDAAQKPRRARTSKPKVKTGCNNCKYVTTVFILSPFILRRDAVREGSSVLTAVVRRL